MALSVSVVVPTFMRGGRVEEVVGPVLADPATLEVVVVVDGCHDGSLEHLAAVYADEPRVRPVWRPNGGDMAARQTGLTQSSGDVVLFLDDDVVPGPGLASGHARAHEGVCGRLVLGWMPTEVPPPGTQGRAASLLYERDYEGTCQAYRAGSDAVLDRLWGGNLSLRRTEALAVGMADPGPRMDYFADQAFGLRLQAAGLQGVFEPTLRAVHRHRRSLQQFRRDARSQGFGLWALHLRFPDRRPAPSISSLLRDLPPVAKPFVRVAWRSVAAGILLERLVMAACAVASRLRSERWEGHGLLLLRVVSQAVGARLALRAVRTA